MVFTVKKNENQNDWRDREIGAIWENQNSLYIIVELENKKHVFKAFLNKFKTEDKHPKWKVYKNIETQTKQVKKIKKSSDEFNEDVKL